MATDGIEERFDLTITWRIENVKRLEIESKWWYALSSIFRSHSLGGKRFQLYFYPKLENKDGNFTSLNLRTLDDPSDFPIDCEWSIIGVDGSIIAGGTKRNCKHHQKTWFTLPGCPEHKEVFVTRQSEFLSRDILTVRCRIKKSRGDVSYDEFISCRTRLESSEHSLLWPISKFSVLKLNEEMSTPMKVGDSGLNDNFLIKFSLKGSSLEDASVNVVLEIVDLSELSIVALKLKILDKEQKVVEHVKGGRPLLAPVYKDVLSFPDIVSRKRLLDNKCDWLRDDILNLHCEIPIIRFTRLIERTDYGFPNTKTEHLKNYSKLPTPNCVTAETDICPQRKHSVACLVDDLRNMYVDQNKTDFELKSEDVSFPVHKNILSARSPVFKAMFSSNMKESGSDSLNVPDLDCHILNRLLSFLYTGTLEPCLQWDNAAKLYYAADKYQVQSLKQDCSCILRSTMSVSNVSDILSLADRHQDEELTDFVYDFIVGHFDEIMDSEEWEDFINRDSALSGKTMHRLYKKKRQLKYP